jgi:myo-inositol catabolism protein IolH
MILAIDTGLFAFQGWEETFDLAARAGFRYVEWSQRAEFKFDETPDAELERVGRLMGRAGLRLLGMIPMVRLASPLEEERKAAVEHWKRFIAITASLGARRIFGEMTGNPAFKAEADLCRRALARSLEELAPLLVSAGMTACFEPHPGDFCEDSDAAADLVRQLGLPSVRYLFCIPHSFVMGARPAPDMVRYAGSTIGHVHLADTHRPTRIIAPAEVRAHEHMIPGWGEVDFPAIVHALRAVDYGGFLTAVLFSHADDPLKAALATREYATGRLDLRLE